MDEKLKKMLVSEKTGLQSSKFNW